MKHLKYLWYVIRHKWYTFLECCKLGIPWLGIVHDWSKFLPSEFIAYARNFYGDYPDLSDSNCHGIVMTKTKIKRDFDAAWLHHQKANKHHWQYWILQYDSGDNWHLQEMSIENPKIIAENGVPLVWCEADDRWNDDAIHTQAYRHCKRIVDNLNLAPVCLPMPDKYRREMLADWRGAGRAITGEDNTYDWYLENRDKILLHPDTRYWVEGELAR